MSLDSASRLSSAASESIPCDAPSIAIVDDDPRIRKLLTEELQDLGHPCASFTDGFELLDRSATETWALVLLDLMMPQLDGVECLKRLRAQGFHKPVVIFTALSDNEKRQEAKSAGADEYILKPDLFDNLHGVIKRHLRPSDS